MLVPLLKKLVKKLKNKCPICGRENNCAVANGKDPRECWCMSIEFPKSLPKTHTCICEECIEKFRKETLEDYTRFVSSADFPVISELFRRSASEYESDDLKIEYEEKFTNYTDANILKEYGEENKSKTLKISNFETLEGKGIKANVGKDLVYIGSVKILHDLKLEYTAFEADYIKLLNEAKKEYSSRFSQSDLRNAIDKLRFYSPEYANLSPKENLISSKRRLSRTPWQSYN